MAMKMKTMKNIDKNTKKIKKKNRTTKMMMNRKTC